MDGGLVHGILADEKVDITIVDLDTEDMEEEYRTKLPRNDGTSVEAFIAYEEVDTSDGAREYLDMLENQG